ncbi:nitric-oxide reductase large subunit [Mesoterricola sediminis]|uniref:Nitric-oxide reductase large subunit n=1 Tax=Mesoterricola sediminis TaxID=2927980 RepID=A0AA48H239_9BACT|nr:nitric-oxide reductase large subunit [Mesoterricola sediminis]BDU78585.1 nitric-oxide reductase large subunit [Mesoterricola sediminis]
MRRLWILLFTVMGLSFAVLGWLGLRIRQGAPPVPARVVTATGERVFEDGDIAAGQNVWQSMGGMELGSIWGHGSYVAPDWTADWLHREATTLLDAWALAERGAPLAALDPATRAGYQERLRLHMRQNRYQPATGTLVVDAERARAIQATAAHLDDVFSRGRDAYAIPAGAQPDPVLRRQLAAFVFWTAWAATTERPGERITYTNNWPYEPLVGNTLTGDAWIWTGVSILLLLAGIGAMAWWHAARHAHGEEAPVAAPATDPLLRAVPTPSQRATVKYFWAVTALILVQVLMGVVTAHYGVEGNGFYGVPLARWLPYVLTRTWHTQLGVLWIATAWLAAGLYIGPAVGGREPAGQALGVNLLFGAVLVLVAGSMAGQWLSVMHRLGTGTAWFYLGHSGYEYIDTGRLWQVVLLVGLFLWLFLVARAVRPAFATADAATRPLLGMFLLASLAIAGFYGAALGYGRHTNLAVAEYWRWWVVHLWVEGFFEVFATVVIAFLFTRLGLLRTESASRAVLLSSAIFLSGGIIGTAHHLYFSGTPAAVMALGATFSALEVVPLMFVGFEAWENLRLGRAAAWVAQYRWPIYCFVAVAFWNMVGAGLFGFMINPPVALYYMQGLNTTPVHGHAALFGVYGMLGIGLMLFCLRALRPGQPWREGPLRFAFWAINGGLMAMIVLSILPLGLLQTRAAVEHGYWFARSAAFLQSDGMNLIRWLRVPGDTLFAAGAFVLVYFIAALPRARA